MEFEQADAVNQAIRVLSLRHRARAAALLTPLGLHPGQEVLLLELARTGPMIQAQLSDALGIEPPSVTLMTRKLETSGHVRRTPAAADRRASVVELTDGGKVLADRVKRLWCDLAAETVTGLPAQTVAALPGILRTLTSNVDTRRRRRDYEPSALGWVREHVDQIMRTGTTDGVTMKDRPMVLLTYRGARTGKVRKTPVMRVEHDGHYAAVASKGGEPTNPDWYRSVLAEPVVDLQDGTTTREYHAREVTGTEKATWWHRAVAAFPDYADYQRGTDREIPVLVLEPTGRLGRTP
ncbi:nitroreductase/quinone reductase family protein [Actinophytocola sp.]|uniref:nitroreductase/quinone reductase family protein n=1 Tax=Actinophytocola sp. TaxID=1872138 RepID=UPI002D7048AC|nr:nitroreductase/quinone reductase family protein [Actinophytocola sp.]HYQ64506.1 nitroreductase/quinone reductase family protein [Actinophytocola sp.]